MPKPSKICLKPIRRLAGANRSGDPHDAVSWREVKHDKITIDSTVRIGGTGEWCFVLSALGRLLIGVGSLRAKVLPRIPLWLLILGAILVLVSRIVGQGIARACLQSPISSFSGDLSTTNLSGRGCQNDAQETVQDSLQTRPSVLIGVALAWLGWWLWQERLLLERLLQEQVQIGGV
jgi:hypothetical protein